MLWINNFLLFNNLDLLNKVNWEIKFNMFEVLLKLGRILIFFLVLEVKLFWNMYMYYGIYDVFLYE